MLDFIVKSVTANGVVTFESFMISSVAAIILGAIVAFTFTYRGRSSHSFTFALAMVPFAVQIVIMIVNNNIGTGIAVAGAFNLVRFRSAPGSAKEIAAIFIAMGIGLACGAGFVGIAAMLCIIACLLTLLYSRVRLGEGRKPVRLLRILIPESLDYTDIFADIFEEYTQSCEMVRVKTANMGSLYKLDYRIIMKAPEKEKEMLDKIRCRNGNLDVSLGRESEIQEML